MAHGYPGAWLGLALLVLCVLALLAIGYGAYTHGAFQATRGRLLLWSGTALLVLAIALANLVVTRTQLIPLYLVAPVLQPAAGLALFASGAALPDGCRGASSSDAEPGT